MIQLSGLGNTSTTEMKLKGFFSIALALSLVAIVGMIVYTSKQTVGDMIRFSEISDFHLSSEFFTYNSKLHDYTAQKSTTRKPFVYLTETEQCLPQNLASSSQIGDPETCNCDVIVLSFIAKCQDNKQSHITYLFDPNTLFASGRNVLFFAAMDRRPGYHYYIFINDDTILKFNEFTPANITKMSPFRAVEEWLLDYEPAVGVLDYKVHHGASTVIKKRRDLCGINESSLMSPFRAVEEWLLDYEPAVGVLDYKVHHGASTVIKKRRDLCGINESSLVLPTVFYDAIFNAFHYEAVAHILPYPTQYERVCMFASNRDTMIAVEVKFGGQALLFSPVTAGNPKHRKYDRSRTNFTEISREFIARIKQEAPPVLRNHVIFEMLHANPKRYLNSESRSFCVNVTRHQPIIPYRHLLKGI
ncbi:uncharacterized protein LOC110051027 [Orbicella faveolata]|uniref:uncharacterized protein LOC110051027 n=1 Tax=Orbicella faveolata TaxID=48498 RepID=UPI0009E54025|nr:uncharacterized protein LOC110051027 [Orbicella faveolata]